MSDKETENFDETKISSPKIRFDLGVTLAVLAVIGLLFGIGSLSEMARNSSSSSEVAESVDVGGTVEAEAIAQVFLDSQKTVTEKGVTETYQDTEGNPVGVIIYNPADDPETIVIYDVFANQYFTDSINSQQGGLSINTLANSLDTLKDFNVISGSNNSYTIQPKQEGNNTCVGVSTKGGLVETIATIDCFTGELLPNTFTTVYQYGVDAKSQELYELGIKAGQDVNATTPVE
jgi:hypothetical protein